MRVYRFILYKNSKFKNKLQVDELNWTFLSITGIERVGHRCYLRREIVQNCEQRHHYFNNLIGMNYI